MYWYSLVNKLTGTEVLIQFNCFECKYGKTCLENLDEILLLFTINNCVPIRTEVVFDLINMDNIFRYNHRQNLYNNKLTQSLQIPVKLNEIDKKNEQKIRNKIDISTIRQNDIPQPGLLIIDPISTDS